MRAIALILLLAFSLTGHAQTENTSPSAGVVKKSKSGICHAPSSPHYGRTKNFTPFVIYRVVLGCALLIALATGALSPQ